MLLVIISIYIFGSDRWYNWGPILFEKRVWFQQLHPDEPLFKSFGLDLPSFTFSSLPFPLFCKIEPFN